MNKRIIEIVTLQTKKDTPEETLMELSHALAESLKREAKGFVKYQLTKSCTQEKWIELVWWDSMEAAQEALKTVPMTNEFQQYESILEDSTDIVYVEEKQLIQ